MSKKRDWSINRDAVKALVAVYGPREAARQSKLPYGTVSCWCRRYKWKKADRLTRTSGINGDPSLPQDDAATALLKAMAQHKEESTLNLAEYVRNASKQAKNTKKDPLQHARQVRDVASVYNTIWPAESEGELIEGAILIGAAPVKDNPAEMLAKATVVE